MNLVRRKGRKVPKMLVAPARVCTVVLSAGANSEGLRLLLFNVKLQINNYYICFTNHFESFSADGNRPQVMVRLAASWLRVLKTLLTSFML